MKLAFAGTPSFAATILRGLLGSEHEVGLVISQPDRPRGRGRKVTRSPVAELATEAGLSLAQPARIGEAAGEISAHDALVVAAYGQILRADTIYAAPSGPGTSTPPCSPATAAPPYRARHHGGEGETGVSLMRMDEGLDTGPFALQLRTPIPPDMTGGELTAALAELGAKAVVEGMSSLAKKMLTLTEQDNDLATYAPKLGDEERVIRWGEPVERVHDRVRALTPHIGARAYHPDLSGPIKVLRARISEKNVRRGVPGTILPAKEHILVACGEGVLEVLELQAPGSKMLSAPDFLRGRRLEGTFSS
ncbi:methionyl-tRNA formyltransferase [Rubrobacter marinus]|uniref:Methionyl-tRNA formyltransferase n=1 Tax=Rubrobacter marinus TaxID=2653852 RepID=A0A6G8PXJ5_9ACTN|nr:methionyl-tRNA formyltransferase [Rubrobacter marinus]QIN78857.1 methionyl-tRNA formyltransferase [Rubrobacter marinus]